MWHFTEERTELWSTLITDFSTDNCTEFDKLKWKCADYAAAGQHAITQFDAPKQAQLVTTIGSGFHWFVPAAEMHSQRFGIALYTRPYFQPMGFTRQCLYSCGPTDKYEVCDFTVRTLGCAQPSKRARLS
jgi:hypothetical protein